MVGTRRVGGGEFLCVLNQKTGFCIVYSPSSLFYRRVAPRSSASRRTDDENMRLQSVEAFVDTSASNNSSYKLPRFLFAYTLQRADTHGRFSMKLYTLCIHGPEDLDPAKHDMRAGGCELRAVAHNVLRLRPCAIHHDQ